LLARLSMDLFGAEHIWAMRLPALLCGIACIPAAFWLGRKVHGDGLGLWMAALAAVDPNLIEQSQQARMYTLLALLLLLALGHALTLLRAPPSDRRPWIALGLLLAALAWTSHLALAAWAGIGAAIVMAGYGQLRNQHRNVLAGALVHRLGWSFGTAILCCAPGFYKLFWRLSDKGPKTVPTATEFIVALHNSSKTIIGLKTVWPIALLAIAGVVLHYRRCRATAVLVAGLALAILLIQVPLRMSHSFLAYRYLTPLAPCLWLALAAWPVMLKGTPQRLASAAALGLLIVWQGWQFGYMQTFEVLPRRCYYGAAVKHVVERRKSGELVLCLPARCEAIVKPYQYPTVYSGYKSDLFSSDPPLMPSPEHRGSGTWIVIDRDRVGDKPSQREMRQMLRTVSACYGARFAMADLPPRLQWKGPAVLHFSSEGVRLYYAQFPAGSAIRLEPVTAVQLASVRGGQGSRR